MKILLATSSFAGGGITSYAHELIANYSCNNEFHVIVGNDTNAPILSDNVIVHHYYCSDTSLKNAKQILGLIESISPDVIISSLAPVVTLLTPFIPQHIKVISVSHSLKYFESDIAGFNNKYSDYIIALSDYNKQHLSKVFHIKDNNKIKVVYNFVADVEDAEKYIYQKSKLEEPIIVFGGGCAPSKTPELVLQIVRELSKRNFQFKFYWVGRTMIHLSKYFPFLRLKDIRELLPDDDRICVTGRLERDELQTLLSKANILLSPSRREGCPILLLEAMRVGTIALVSDYDNANKEIIVDGQNGFVIDHDNPSAFVDKIEAIAQSPLSFVEIYSNAYATFKKSLNFDSWKRHMDSIIFDVVSNHRKRKKFNVIHYCWKSFLLNCLRYKCKLCVTVEEDLKVLFSFYFKK